MDEIVENEEEREENLVSAQEGVQEKVCKERVERIEQKIESSAKLILTKFEALDKKLDMVIDTNGCDLDRHETEIRVICEDVKAMGIQVTQLVQNRINGEKFELKGLDRWHKRQSVRIAFWLLVFTVINQAKGIAATVKAIVIAISGGILI